MINLPRYGLAYESSRSRSQGEPPGVFTSFSLLLRSRAWNRLSGGVATPHHQRVHCGLAGLRLKRQQDRVHPRQAWTGALPPGSPDLVLLTFKSPSHRIDGKDHQSAERVAQLDR
jgi:hypothetical protein